MYYPILIELYQTCISLCHLQYMLDHITQVIFCLINVLTTYHRPDEKDPPPILPKYTRVGAIGWGIPSYTDWSYPQSSHQFRVCVFQLYKSHFMAVLEFRKVISFNFHVGAFSIRFLYVSFFLKKSSHSGCNILKQN